MTQADTAPVRLIKANALSSQTGQTSGIQRFEAISSRMAGARGIWMGYSVLPPGEKTGAHHHGESETALYMLRGKGRFLVGERLDQELVAEAGDFLYIPPHTVHVEENASDTEPAEMIVARSTQEAIVINLDEPR
ncbi:MAG: cupin domain-containing protein [Chloroflexi bacterium]|jgi:uncharacterized RmlC-like cupin family protein|nr:cupin domain-containing protein [Chloroflexota bacterium]